MVQFDLAVGISLWLQSRLISSQQSRHEDCCVSLQTETETEIDNIESIINYIII